MSKSTLSIWASIFFVGFIAGFFVVVGFKYGVSPDQIGILNVVLQHICTIEKNNQQVVYNCSIFVPLGIILSIVAGVASIWIEANRIQNWKVGLAIYVVGWVIGLLYALSNVK